MKRIVTPILFILVSLRPNSAPAQALGSITGTVSEATGAVVPRAHVKIVNQGTNVEHEVDANQAGYFVFSLLPIGVYTVRVTQNGFESSVSSNISLEGEQTVSLDIKLTLGTVNESVNVSAETQDELVRRTDPTLSQTIHAEQVTNLPLNGRDFVQLALLAPGTSKADQPSDFLNQGTSSEVSFRGSVSLSIQGMAESANDWRYDGVDDNELTAGGVGFLPEIDAIQEFNVLTFNYSAQYGSRGGGTILVSSKSGTNSLHGTLFEFFRNDVLDARNYFDPPKKGEYRQNQFGGSVGGPILKDKLFFFGDYQGNRVRQGAPILSTIPTGVEITNHIFPNPIFDPTNYTSTAGSRPNYWNPAISAYQIPSSEISPVGQAILNLFPTNAPATGTNGFPTGINYRSNPIRSLNDDEADLRIDDQLRTNDRIFARFSRDNAIQFNPSGLPGYGSASAYTSTTTFQAHPRNVALSETHVFSARVVNQVAAGYNKDYNYIHSIGYGTDEAQTVGITGVNVGPAVSSGMTLVSITGYNPIGDRDYSPYRGGTNIFHFFDSVSVVKGNHSMVFGFDYRPQEQNGIGETYFHGALGFTKNFTGQIGSSQTFAATVTDPVSGITGANGNPIASVLLGLPDNGDLSTQINSSVIGRRWKEFRGYGQDNWTVSPRLTLNLGLAYGVTTPLSEEHSRISNFNFLNGDYYIAGSGATPYLSPTVLQSNEYADVSTDFSNIEPRFGFAYSPFALKRGTVIRGGYGIFHDNSHLGASNGIHQNPPYTNAYSFSTNDITPSRVLIPGSPINGFPSNSTPQDPATYTGSLVANALNFRQGLVQQYNVNLQQGLSDGTVITAAYAGTHATRIINNVSNWNVAPPGPGNNPATSRPFPTLQTINPIISNGSLLYNSFQMRLERRVRDFYLLAAYTYAQGISNGYEEGVSGGGGDPYFPLTLRTNIPVDGTSAPISTRIDRGNSSLTQRNDFSASAVYSLPFGAGKRFVTNENALTNQVIGGWQANTIIISHSGYPLTFSEATNTSGSGVSNRPDVNYSCNLYTGEKKVSEWFNESCFTTPTAETLGNAPRTYGYGPGRTNVDLSFYKTFPIYEKQRFELRAEFFNILNHSQFGTPGTSFGSATFAVITTTVEENRQAQFAAKYIF